MAYFCLIGEGGKEGIKRGGTNGRKGGRKGEEEKKLKKRGGGVGGVGVGGWKRVSSRLPFFDFVSLCRISICIICKTPCHTSRYYP